MSSYLPSTEDGYLPLVVLLVAVVTLGNVVQCYTTLHYSQRIYTRTTVTPLAARTFGTWNIAVAVARIYACYHMSEPSWYQMSMWTYVIGLFHFGTEAFVFKSCKPSGPWLAPIATASTCFIWHVLQYNNYVR